jgi:phosphate transport system substrate-binding protein
MMLSIRNVAAALTVVAGLGLAAPVGAQQITGAGATFPAPVYTKWGEAFQQAGAVSLNYQAIGSGGGVNQIRNRTVDFGATDAPVAGDALNQANLVQFPMVMGGVVLVINVDGVAVNQMKLTNPIVADIFLGKIRNWNDPRIQGLNPDLRLPNLAIAPAYRADASGTTFVFTSYLASVSPEWKDSVGAATSVEWKAGTGARGNDGVAATVRNTRGGIGYVESAFATQNRLTTVQLQNRTGNFLSPTLETFQAAASSADWDSDPNFAVSLLNQPGPNAWPIVSATFILLPRNPTDATRSANVMRFFDWAYKSGDKLATGLEYVPMPDSVAERVRVKWRTLVKGPNGQALYN